MSVPDNVSKRWMVQVSLSQNFYGNHSRRSGVSLEGNTSITWKQPANLYNVSNVWSRRELAPPTHNEASDQPVYNLTNSHYGNKYREKTEQQINMLKKYESKNSSSDI